MAVAYWVEQMGVVSQKAMDERKNQALEAELAKFMESFRGRAESFTGKKPQERTWNSHCMTF